MTRKSKAFWGLALYILFLLSGCSVKPLPGKESTEVTEESKPTNAVTIPEQSGIYFAAGNDYYDLYPNYSWVPGPEITMFSSEHIDPSSIQVSADIQADYSVYVTEQITGASLTSYHVIESDGKRDAYIVAANAYDYPLYLFQTYAGMDWTTLGNQYTAYYDIMEKYSAGEVNEAEVQTALNQYNYLATEYINEYSELVVDDIPTFYEYSIKFVVNKAEADEILTTVQVIIGETVYEVNVGKVYIRSYSEKSNGYDYFSMQRSCPYWLNCYPYGMGIEKCQSGIYYAEESITLTGLHFLENLMSTVTVLDVVVVISDDKDMIAENGIEIEWNGITPLYVEKGKYVTLFITFQDERLKEINYHSKIYPVWEFEYENATYNIFTEIPLQRFYTDKWLLYTIGWGGLDMESYFNDYYYLQPTNSWRNDVDLAPWGAAS